MFLAAAHRIDTVQYLVVALFCQSMPLTLDTTPMMIEDISRHSINSVFKKKKKVKNRAGEISPDSWPASIANQTDLVSKENKVQEQQRKTPSTDC